MVLYVTKGTGSHPNPGCLLLGGKYALKMTACLAYTSNLNPRPGRGAMMGSGVWSLLPSTSCPDRDAGALENHEDE
jgi:hypothetical protein